MEKFNVAYRTISGEIVQVEEEFENISAAVDAKSKMFNFDEIPSGTYYSFITEDGGTAMINPKCIESVRVVKIAEEATEGN